MTTNNVLTGLVQNAYRAWNVVSREKVGFLQAVYMPPPGLAIALAPGGVTQTYRVPIAAVPTLGDNTPALEAPDTGEETSSYADITISASKHAPVKFTGEEALGLTTSGSYDALYQSRLEEGFRKLINQMEADAYAAIRVKASRAYGTAGTPPFATVNVLTDIAKIAEILDDNGAPSNDRQLVLATSAITNLRGVQAQLFKVNEAGASDMLRNGMTDRLEGFALRQSGQITTITKGTGGTSYYTNYGSAASGALGDVTIPIDTGSGTILAGDVITFNGDTNKYVVATGVAAAGNLVIAAPGLKATLADGVQITVEGNGKRNLAFDRRSVVGLIRNPAMGPDKATARYPMTDPLTGIEFELAVYPGFGQTVVHIRSAWGFGVVRPEHVAILHG